MALRRNLIANYLGQIWTALMGLVFVPVYIQYLGLESYGLIGFFSVMLAWLTLLDLGMSPTLNRELARFTAGTHSADTIGDLLRTFETICIGLAASIFAGVTLSSTWIAQHWLNTNTLSFEQVGAALMLMGAVAALRFQESLYRSAILGFQKHVWLNLVTSVLATLRGVGAIAVLHVKPNIEAFFIWQACISLLTVAVLRWRLGVYLPTPTRQARFAPGEFGESWKFAKGILLTTLLALLLTQIDKVLLSRLLTLEQFGVYTFATSVVGVLAQLMGPVTQSYFPRFSELTARGDERMLASSYHQASQLMSFVLLPVGLTLGLYAYPIIKIWSGNIQLAHEASPIVALLVVGTVLNGFMQIPYMLQLAHGWPMFSVRVNLVTVCLIVPTLLLVIPRYGAIGAAWVWFVVNCFYFSIAIHFMHRRLLPNEKWRWYGADVLIPSIFAILVAIAFFNAIPQQTGIWQNVVCIIAAAGSSGLAAMLTTALGRQLLSHGLRSLFNR